MKLYLVQHGEATTENVDPARPLTEKGKADVGKVARFLAGCSVRVDEIWHSTKLRAIQTAEIIAAALRVKNVCEKDGLTPNDPVEPIAQEAADSKRGSLMLVGHLPFMSKMASHLVTGSAAQEIVAFRQGGVVALSQDELGQWRFLWAVVPELIND